MNEIYTVRVELRMSKRKPKSKARIIKMKEFPYGVAAEEAMASFGREVEIRQEEKKPAL